MTQQTTLGVLVRAKHSPTTGDNTEQLEAQFEYVECLTLLNGVVRCCKELEAQGRTVIEISAYYVTYVHLPRREDARPMEDVIKEMLP